MRADSRHTQANAFRARAGGSSAWPKQRRVRLGNGTLALLLACAAFAAAAIAHVAIDVVGDFALPHDTYDYIAHNSRDLVSGIAFTVAAVGALRWLHTCLTIASANRGRQAATSIGKWRAAAFVFGTSLVASILVPAMEVLDGKLDKVPVKELDDAFGGSVLLGLGVTVVCAALVAALLLSLTRWLLAHRDFIATVVIALVKRAADAPPGVLAHAARRVERPQKRRTAPGLRRCKRGPPSAALILRTA
jgi:hypothetical protein